MFNTFRSVCLAAVTLAVTSNLSLAASLKNNVEITAQVLNNFKFKFVEATSKISLGDLDSVEAKDKDGSVSIYVQGNVETTFTLADSSKGRLCLGGDIANATDVTKSIPYSLEISDNNELVYPVVQGADGTYSVATSSEKLTNKGLGVAVTIKSSDFNGSGVNQPVAGTYSAVLVLIAAAV